MAGNIRAAKNKAYEFIAELNPHLSNSDIDTLMGLNTLETFKELILEAGVQKEDEKELIAAFKKYIK